MGERVGYKRVSTPDQRFDRQLVGVALDRVFAESASGSSTNRPELTAALKYLREGDTLFTHSIDRLARNLDDLRRLVKELTARGVTVTFITENLTFEPNGKGSAMSAMLLSVMGALGEFERRITDERRAEGIAQAKLRGVYKGRKPALSPAVARALVEAAKNPDVSLNALAKEFGISARTVSRYLRRHEPREEIA